MGKKHKKHKKDPDGSEGLEIDTDSTQMSDKGGEKPLKLVLKVGPQEGGDGFSPTPPEEKPKHKHKKKKKKKEKDPLDEGGGGQKRSHPQDQGDGTGTADDEPALKKMCTDTDGVAGSISGGELSDERGHRSPRRACTIRNDDGAILKQCLQYLQKILQDKDVNGFFAFPVTDAIAPGYSNIISIPMDFSTMETKIENNEYRNVMEYKKDFMTMCNNAMTYNRPETVYYKEAKRLVHIGIKQLSKDRLLNMKKTQSWLANLTLAEIGIDENGKYLEEMPPIPEEQRIKDKSKSKSTKIVQGPFEPFPDTSTPEEILSQAQAAAKEAKQDLTLRKPQTDFTFFRRNKKGVTTMTIINQDNSGIVSDTERVVNLGEIVGKLPSGTGAVGGFREDKRNKVTPISYVNYGPFSSFAPQYDSSFANVSKEESDLLIATYGDETGVQYAKSVQSFVDSAGDYAVKMVNNLLDMLTKGQHTRTNMMLEQQRRLEEQKAAEEKDTNAEAAEKNPTDGSTSCTKSQGENEEEPDPVQKRLNSTAELIGDLRRTQEARLSQPLPAHLAHVPGPSDKEMELAAKVTAGLANLSKDAAPGDLVGVRTLHSAMGISTHPLTSQHSALDDETQGDDTLADDKHGDETLDENLDNLPSVGMASESMVASQATEDDDEEDDVDDDDDDDDDDDEDEEDEEDEDEEEVEEGVDDGVDFTEGAGEGEEGEMGSGETSSEQQGITDMSGEAADLSEFFSSPSAGGDVSMEETT